MASLLLYYAAVMNTPKVVSLQAARELKKAQEEDYAYEARILGMDKLGLLNEMVHFQEERSARGHLTPSMMIRGKVLFRALETQAETAALQALSRSYRRHLDLELSAYLTQKKAAQFPN